MSLEPSNEIGLLADQPRLGVAREDLASGLGMLVYGRYLIFYRYENEIVRVARIIHSSRDTDAIDFAANDY